MIRFMNLTASLAVLSACATPRIDIARAPTVDAALAERQTFYMAHRPTVIRTADVVRTMSSERSSSFIILEDGARIERTTDLLPNVEPTSATAQAVARSQEAETNAALWRIGGVVGLGASAALALVDAVILLPSLTEQSVGPNPDLALAYFALSLSSYAVGVGGAVALFVSWAADAKVASEANAAFMSYDSSLQERLGLTHDTLGPPHRSPAVPDDQGVIHLMP